MIRNRFVFSLTFAALVAGLSLQLQARQLPGLPNLPAPIQFSPGDLLVSLEPGPVVWFNSSGTLQRMLIPTVTGLGEGLAFDAAWNLHVARWCTDPNCTSTGNAVERYNTLGISQGAVGSNFNCSPHTIDFDSTGAVYIGQAGCSRTILKFAPGLTGTPIAEYTVAQENQGVFWMDLAPDNCTMFYTSVGPNVKRFNVCTNTQMADFNVGSLPGPFTHDLRVLPDGGVLVANANLVTRLDASGAVVRTYGVPENTLFAGLDLVGDGTFWAGNYFTSSIYRFNLDTGAQLASFNAGTPANSVVGIRVKR
jgi:outer membrane protein assembly factor BamB